MDTRQDMLREAVQRAMIGRGCRGNVRVHRIEARPPYYRVTFENQTMGFQSNVRVPICSTAYLYDHATGAAKILSEHYQRHMVRERSRFDSEGFGLTLTWGNAPWRSWALLAFSVLLYIASRLGS